MTTGGAGARSGCNQVVIDLLDESRYQTLFANPALLVLELRTLPPTESWCSMESSASLLNEVHRAIEGARRHLVLLGSSARRLKTADTNVLAGRAALRTMYPLVPAELGADFDLARVLRFLDVSLGSSPVLVPRHNIIRRQFAVISR